MEKLQFGIDNVINPFDRYNFGGNIFDKNKENAEYKEFQANMEKILESGEYAYWDILSLANIVKNAMPNATYSPTETLEAISCFAEAKLPYQVSASLLPATLDAASNSKIGIKSIAYDLATQYQHLPYIPTERYKHVDDSIISADPINSYISFGKLILSFTPVANLVSASGFAEDFFSNQASIQKKAIEEYGKSIHGTSWYNVFGEQTYFEQNRIPDSYSIYESLAAIETDNYINSIEALNGILLNGYIYGKELYPDTQETIMQLTNTMIANADELIANRKIADSIVINSTGVPDMNKKDYGQYKKSIGIVGDMLLNKLKLALSDGVVDDKERVDTRNIIVALSRIVYGAQYDDSIDDAIHNATLLSEESIDANISKYSSIREAALLGSKPQDQIKAIEADNTLLDFQKAFMIKDNTDFEFGKFTKSTNEEAEIMFRYYKTVFEDVYPKLYSIGTSVLPMLEDFKANLLPSIDINWRNEALDYTALTLMENKMREKGIRFKDSDSEVFRHDSDNYLSLFPIDELQSRVKYYQTNKEPIPEWLIEALEFNDLVMMLRRGNQLEDQWQWGQGENPWDEYIKDESEQILNNLLPDGIFGQTEKSEIPFPLEASLNFLQFRDLLNPFSIIKKQKPLPNNEIEIQQMWHNSMENFLNFFKWKRHAQGGRADEASIFGEAGPEWAIPERHDERTAELLNSAREASGFSWTELIASTGGLNGGGSVVNNNITYAPVVHANDARGVDEVLRKDKQLLDDWLKQKQWELARTQWA